VVQTTKVEEPAPETGNGFFDSSQPRRPEASRSRALYRFYSAPPRFLPANSANNDLAEGFARVAVETLLATSLAGRNTLPATSLQQLGSIQEK